MKKANEYQEICAELDEAMNLAAAQCSYFVLMLQKDRIKGLAPDGDILDAQNAYNTFMANVYTPIMEIKDAYYRAHEKREQREADERFRNSPLRGMIARDMMLRKPEAES